MKLIVLYGPENSGKTTTLKIVYEVIKRVNTCETNFFQYLDLNTYLDYLDVLDLETQPTKTYIGQCLSISPSSPSSPSLVLNKNLSENDMLNKRFNCVNGTVALSNNYRNILNSINRLAPSGKTKRVGIELEGDYGRKHQGLPSLYDHLDKLRRAPCEIIICACNEKTATVKNVLKFKQNASADVYCIPVSTSLMTNAGNVLFVLHNLL